MTFLTYNKFVNEELEKFYEESNKHGDLKMPVDFVSKNYESPSGNAFVVEPKMKKTQVKKKKTWNGINKSKGLF